MKTEPLHTSAEALSPAMGNTIMFAYVTKNPIGFEGCDTVSTIRETTYFSFIRGKYKNKG